MFTESHLKLTVWVNKEHVVEGNSLSFHCNVSAAENSLSMSWWHTQIDRDPVLIASMAQDGRLEIGTSYLERGAHGDLRIEKVDSFTFTLTIYNTSATTDTGLYRCEVTEWYRDRSWKYIEKISAEVESLGKMILFSHFSSNQGTELLGQEKSGNEWLASQRGKWFWSFHLPSSQHTHTFYLGACLNHCIMEAGSLHLQVFPCSLELTNPSQNP